MIKTKRGASISLNTKRSIGKAPWPADAPVHLPYDDAGRPLFRVTVCPGFTGEPKKTNTYTGAY